MQMLDVEDRRASFVQACRRGAALAVQAVLLIGLLLLFFLRVPQVDGHSMAPQIDAGEHVVIDTLAYDLRIDWPGRDGRPLVDWRLRSIGRGDIVAFVHGAGDDRRIYLKRVIGLPGDLVAMDRGVVWVNGTLLPEPYAPQQDTTDMSSLRVPQDAVFVLGDNRGDSDDSRSFGPVSAGAVVGRAAIVIWPPNRAHAIR